MAASNIGVALSLSPRNHCQASRIPRTKSRSCGESVSARARVRDRGDLDRLLVETRADLVAAAATDRCHRQVPVVVSTLKQEFE